MAVSAAHSPAPEPAYEPAHEREHAPEPHALPEESDQLKNALASDYLAHRARDPFDLLGLPGTAEAAQGPARPSTEAQFRIQTNLLDGAAQFEEGKKRLAAGNARGALEYFQYAADIEPRATHWAHLAWARFRVDPERHGRLALGELAELARKEPGCVEAHRFSAEIQKSQGRWAEAEEAYRRAFQLDPSDRRSQEAALEMLRARKAAQR